MPNSLKIEIDKARSKQFEAALNKFKLQYEMPPIEKKSDTQWFIVTYEDVIQVYHLGAEWGKMIIDGFDVTITKT